MTLDEALARIDILNVKLDEMIRRNAGYQRRISELTVERDRAEQAMRTAARRADIMAQNNDALLAALRSNGLKP